MISVFVLQLVSMDVFWIRNREDRVFKFFLVKILVICLFSVILVSDYSGREIPVLNSVPANSEGIFFKRLFSALEKILALRSNPSQHKIENRVLKGDTITKILEREGIEYNEAFRLFLDVRDVYDLKKIRRGQKYSLVFQEGQLKTFSYEIDSHRYLKAISDKNRKFIGRIERIYYRIERKIIRGIIEDSLYLSILKRGERADLADLLASLFEYDIDFNRDIRQGDTFTVLVEKWYQGSEFSHYGPILAARFSNRDRIIHVLRYTDPQGKTAYYHPDGQAVQKMFLRCPLPFMRVTSRYGIRRHPVLGFSARHNGVDLAAPPGTLIRSTSSGVISKTGYERIKGRYVIIRHPNRYATHYYHLNRIKTGIRPGVSVIQGQIIGYVGRTGRVTGWHLHYGIRKNGRFINPLNLKSPSKNPVKKAFRQNFEQYGAAMLFLLSGSRILDIPARLQRFYWGLGQVNTVRVSEPVVVH